VYFEVEKYITLNSNSDLTYYFSGFSNKEFYLVIDNEDNPPIENIELAAYQLNRYLIAYFESCK
jgi:hypothetical protein